MAKEKWTVFLDPQPTQMAPANWKEKELVTGEGKEKNAGYLTAAPGTVITNIVQTCKFVTVEAESAAEALKAVARFYTGGVTNPEKNAPAVPITGVAGGGWVQGNGLACKTSSLTEEAANP
jgi:hypothetical protein